MNALKRELENQKGLHGDADKANLEEIARLKKQVQEEAAKVQTLSLVSLVHPSVYVCFFRLPDPSFSDHSQSKGEEVQELIRGYTAEKAQLEEGRQQKIRELEEARALLEKLRQEKTQEISVWSPLLDPAVPLDYYY